MKVIGKKHSKQYTLKQIIGEGSFGKVYKSDGFAVKEMSLNLPPYLKSALENEIKILKTFQHKNIVELIDVIYQNNYAYLIMQYCQDDLHKYLKKKKINEQQAIQIFKQIIEGFQQLVGKGVIHRDLKPANILVSSKGLFKLADFGFAKFVDSFDSNMLQSLVGTPLYMAPQILKKQKYTTKCDIWSIGFIFYELAVGNVPWSGFSEANLLENINKNPLVLPEKLSSWSREILRRMLIVNEGDRISWEQLFKYVLSKEPRERSKSKPKSEKQIKMQPRQIISCPEQAIIDLFTIELKEHFDVQHSKKIANGRPYKVSKEERPKVIDILQLFTEQLQSFLKKNLLFQ